MFCFVQTLLLSVDATQIIVDHCYILYYNTNVTFIFYPGMESSDEKKITLICVLAICWDVLGFVKLGL